MKILYSVLIFLLFFNCKKEKESVAQNAHNKSEKTETIKIDSSKINKKDSNIAIFNFQTEMCDNKGYFDSNKYSKEDIEGTFKLYYEFSSIFLDSPSVFYLKDLKNIRENKETILKKLDKDFLYKKKLFDNLKFVNTPFWNNARNQIYKELLDEYELKKIEINAFSNPEILKNNQFEKDCKIYVDAVNGSEQELLQQWKVYVYEESKQNGDPEGFIKKYEDKLNSPNKIDYAIIDLISFGWGNCANNKIRVFNIDEKTSNEFEKLFIKIDSDCEEP